MSGAPFISLPARVACPTAPVPDANQCSFHPHFGRDVYCRTCKGAFCLACVAPFAGNAHQGHTIIPLPVKIDEEMERFRTALKTRADTRRPQSPSLEERVIAEHNRILHAADAWMKKHIQKVRARGECVVVYPGVFSVWCVFPVSFTLASWLDMRTTARDTEILLSAADPVVRRMEADVSTATGQPATVDKLQLLEKHVQKLQKLQQHVKPLTLVPMTEQDLKEDMDALCGGLLV